MNINEAREVLNKYKKAIVEMECRAEQPEEQMEYGKIEQALAFALALMDRVDGERIQNILFGQMPIKEWESVGEYKKRMAQAIVKYLSAEGFA